MIVVMVIIIIIIIDLDFSLAFNPRDLYYRGYKKKFKKKIIIIIIIISRCRHLLNRKVD